MHLTAATFSSFVNIFLVLLLDRQVFQNSRVRRKVGKLFQVRLMSSRTWSRVPRICLGRASHASATPPGEDLAKIGQQHRGGTHPPLREQFACAWSPPRQIRRTQTRTFQASTTAALICDVSGRPVCQQALDGFRSLVLEPSSSSIYMLQ
jgi:hypothetical protein